MPLLNRQSLLKDLFLKKLKLPGRLPQFSLFFLSHRGHRGHGTGAMPWSCLPCLPCRSRPCLPRGKGGPDAAYLLPSTTPPVPSPVSRIEVTILLFPELSLTPPLASARRRCLAPPRADRGSPQAPPPPPLAPRTRNRTRRAGARRNRPRPSLPRPPPAALVLADSVAVDHPLTVPTTRTCSRVT